MQAMTELPSAGGDVEVLQPVFRFMFDLMRRVRSALCKETLHTVANRHQLSACECQLPRHAVVGRLGQNCIPALTGRTASALMAQSIRNVR